jgi:PAS domain S-box-containing protein
VATEHGAACEAVTGYTSDDFASNPYLWLRMVVEADKAAVLEQGRRLLSGQKPGPFEHRIVRKDGQTRWVRNTSVPHFDPQGKLLYYDGVIQDITDRKEAEDALRLTQFAMDHCAIPVFWIGPSGRFLYVNEAAAQSLGHPREQLLYLGVPDINPELTTDRWPTHWAELKREKILRWEGRHRRQDGQFIPVEITANYLEFNGREYDFAFVRDIGQQQQAQDKARQSQEMLRLVLDHVPQRVFWKGRDFRYLGCNRAFLEDAGLQDAGELVGKEDSELPWKESAAAYRADDQSVMERDAPKLDSEESQPMRGGGARWIKISKLPMHGQDGKAIAVLGTYEDVTRRKESEDSLRFSQFALDHCSIPAHWVDPRGRFLYVNEAACRTLGYSREELASLSVWDVDAGMKAETWDAFWKKLREQRSVVLETCERAKDGRLFPVEVVCSYLEHSGRERCFAFVQDISERKRSEESQGS